jgi:succinate dehydrogenase / fumarate reductase, cytochrome b subunit
MNWFTKFLSSSLGKKLIMALTGLFLISFLVIHLIGNLQLLHDDGGRAFNIYARFMTTNPLIKTISYLLYTSIVIHAAWALLLTLQNRKARGEGKYAITNKSSAWTSRNMGVLGTLIFIFIIIHMRQFWAEMHWGGIPMATYDGEQVKDLYSIVALAFAEPLYVALYVISMMAMAFHLWHGFSSAFQTLGINHLKYNGIIEFVGRVIAVIVPASFAWIPIKMFFLS